MRMIELIKQPTANSCGPTCLMMLWKVVSNSYSPDTTTTIEKICEMCGTDWVVGTPPDRMEKGMKKLGINYVEYIHSPRPYELLKQIIDSGNIGLLRTITKGIPHWIIVDGYFNDEQTFSVVDPWLGYLVYTKDELNGVWKQRQYQFFEIIPTK